MKLTLQTDYAIRVLTYIGANRAGRSTIHEMALRYGISENHLMKVVNKLTQLGYLDSIRGRMGGLKLNESVLNEPLGTLIQNIENNRTMVPCLDDASACIIEGCCVFRGAVQEAEEAYFRSLNRYKFGDLLKPNLKLTKALKLSVDPTMRGLEAN